MSRIKYATPALVVAVAAVIVALVATAAAGPSPKAESSASPARVAIFALKKANRSLRRANFALRVARNTSKQQGPQGEQGEPGASGYELVSNELVSNSGSGGSVNSSVECPGTKSPLGGGVDVFSAYELADIGGTQFTREVKLLETYPSSTSRWAGGIKNEHTDTLQVTWRIWAVCANVTT